MFYQGNVDWRSRSYADSTPAAQRMDQRLQKMLLDDTVDFDIKNCMPMLLVQIVSRLRLRDQQAWKEEMETLRRVAFERDDWCERDLGMPVSLGKQMLQKLLQGSSPAPELKDNKGVKRVVDLARFLRWWACSVASDIFDAIRQETESNSKKWPESSTMAYLWQGVEDHILRAMLDYVCQEPVSHVSLHYDGVRVDKTRVSLEGSREDCVQVMCKRLSESVKEATGYEVTIVAKRHSYFLELLEDMTSEIVLPAVHPRLLAAGNCIPLNLACLTGKTQACQRYIEEEALGGSQDKNPSRAYRDVAADFHVQLSPVLNHQLIRVGRWLLHMENGTAPTCVAIDFRADNECVLFWRGKQTVVSPMVLRGIMISAVDKKTLVLFEVLPLTERVAEIEPNLVPLLDLLTCGK